MGYDPETHHVTTYMGILVGYAAGITILGYFVVKRAVAKRSG
jgi:hypothetical protein